MISRFAPSTTGEAHPGTLASALLVWLDARQRGGRALLRLEDLDPSRTKAVWREQMVEALAWLGLEWDEVVVQSERGEAHAAALDTLAAAGRLYACSCGRSARTRPAPDGGMAYDNTCRARVVRDWKSCAEPLRARLDDDRIELIDELGVDLSQTPAVEMGDPIVRRRDGAVAYQLAVVVDDAAAGVTDVVRGRDIAPSTATQVMLQRLLGVSTPVYRHHFLMLEVGRGEKLAKLHGSIPFSTVKTFYAGVNLAELLVKTCGLASMDPAAFDWADVRRDDVVVRWDAERGLVFE